MGSKNRVGNWQRNGKIISEMQCEDVGVSETTIDLDGVSKIFEGESRRCDGRRARPPSRCSVVNS